MNMPYPFPSIQKLPPFYGGQFGVPGSSAPYGHRYHPDAVILYVDSGYAGANDNNDGVDPLAPKATVQTDDELAALLVDGGLPLPANIKAATDEDVIAAVGSENLAAVRVRFPEIEQ